MNYGYPVQQFKDGSMLTFGNGYFYVLDKNGSLKESNGTPLQFIGLGNCKEGYRYAHIEGNTYGYLREEDFSLICFKANYVSDIENGFGLITTTDNKYRFFDAKLHKLLEEKYDNAFITGMHTRVVGNNNDGWKVLFDNSSYLQAYEHTQKTFATRQEALKFALDWESTPEKISRARLRKERNPDKPAVILDNPNISKK